MQVLDTRPMDIMTNFHMMRSTTFLENRLCTIGGIGGKVNEPLISFYDTNGSSADEGAAEGLLPPPTDTLAWQLLIGSRNFHAAWHAQWHDGCGCLIFLILAIPPISPIVRNLFSRKGVERII